MQSKSEFRSSVSTPTADPSDPETADSTTGRATDSSPSRKLLSDSFRNVPLEQTRYHTGMTPQRPSRKWAAAESPVVRKPIDEGHWYALPDVQSRPRRKPAQLSFLRPMPLVRPVAPREAPVERDAPVSSFSPAPVKASTHLAAAALKVALSETSAVRKPVMAPVKAFSQSPATALKVSSSGTAMGPPQTAEARRVRSEGIFATPRSMKPWEGVLSMGAALAKASTVDRRSNAPRPAESKLADRMLLSAFSARAEWTAGVEETEVVRSPRIDEYLASVAGSSNEERSTELVSAATSPKADWAGAFVAFNYAQQGFRHAASLGSLQKAKEFFLYREPGERLSAAAAAGQDAVRAEHTASGGTRRYIMLEESPDISRISGNPGRYGHVDVAASVFRPERLPIEPGDTIVFCESEHSDGYLGIVLIYDRPRGMLVTLEGNSSGEAAGGSHVQRGVVRNVYDLKDPDVRILFGGFGRPAADDFE